MYYPPSFVKEIHEERLRELGVLPQRQLVRFPVGSPFPGLRRWVQVGARVVVLAVYHTIHSHIKP